MSAPQQADRFGVWLDRWIPRVLKVLGLAGFALVLIVYAQTRTLEPVLLGASLAVASGGYLKDAARAMPGRREESG